MQSVCPHSSISRLPLCTGSWLTTYKHVGFWKNKIEQARASPRTSWSRPGMAPGRGQKTPGQKARPSFWECPARCPQGWNRSRDYFTLGRIWILCLRGSQLDTMTSRSGWSITSSLCSGISLRVTPGSRAVTGHDVALTRPHLPFTLHETLPRSADDASLSEVRRARGSCSTLCVLSLWLPRGSRPVSLLPPWLVPHPPTGLPVSELVSKFFPKMQVFPQDASLFLLLFEQKPLGRHV